MITYNEAAKELYYSLRKPNATNFHAILYHLIGKADTQNKALLRLGFPMEVLVWDDWQQSGNENEFFAHLGFKVWA